MAKCFRCDAEIAVTGEQQQFIEHMPVHSSVDKCHEALLKDYQAKLLVVEKFQNNRNELDRLAQKQGQSIADAKAKALQEAAIKEEAEKAKAEAAPKPTGALGAHMNPPFGSGAVLTPEQQKAKDEADANKKAEADEQARRAQAKKNQEEKDEAARSAKK